MNDLAFGLQITVLGMGLVFAMLGLLWALLTLAARLDRPPAPTEPDALAAPGLEPARGAAGLGAEEVVAIAAAVAAHAAYRRHQAAPAMRSYWPGSLLFASRWVAAGRTRQSRIWERRR